MIEWNLDIETASMCNRVCKTCVRNSHPDRDLVADWFSPKFLPTEIIHWLIINALDIGTFSKTVCLNYFNEPFLDPRISDIAWSINEYHDLKEVYMHSNGDLVTEDIAKGIDGALDKIIFTLYMDEPLKTIRKEWLQSLFNRTKLVFVTENIHGSATHFSPKFPVAELTQQHIDHTCIEPSMRVAVNHRAEYMMCCEDLVGNFNLGTFPEVSIQEHLLDKMAMQSKLMQFGGRREFPYCSTCPKA